jgi:hypothetical protein
MFLHASPVNAAREARGLPVANGLWPWGAGELPEGLPAPWSAFYAADGFSAGLAALGGLPMLDPPAGADGLSGGDTLVCLWSGLAPEGHAGAAGLERDWFAPALEGLRSGRWGVVELYLSGGEAIRVPRAALRRWWRRRRPLERLLAGGWS